MRSSRERPDLAHDFTAQRLLTLERAFAACGVGGEHVDAAFEVYYAARNAVECYADALPALAALAARVPLVSISNGNADLERIGLRHHFRHCISAREIGHAKPHAGIFHVACEQLGVAPAHVLHVGDDPLLDVDRRARRGPAHGVVEPQRPRVVPWRRARSHDQRSQRTGRLDTRARRMTARHR